MQLGFRQMPVEWWPATPLYFVDYRDEEARARLNDKVPLKVSLKRARESLRKGAMDGFEIDRIEDVDTRTIPRDRLRLRLQTIGEAQGYWLDTGVIMGR
jgi:hypothetical protein